MTTIIGIDASLVSTGLARITTDGTDWLAETGCAQSKPTSTTVAGRAARVRRIVADVLDFVLPCDVAVLEAPIFGGSFGQGTFERGWLWGAIASKLVEHSVPVLDVAPKTRASFAAQAGGADKAAVALAVGRMWPHWTPGVSAGVNDQADALALASIGVVLVALEPPFAMPAYRTKALAKIPRLEIAA